MLKMLPKIEDLIVSNFWTSKETNTELLKISFKNKFKTLSLKLDKNFHIDAAEIFKFLKKNACSTCKIYINLKMHRSLLDSFQKTIDENINAFWRGKEKPYFEALRYKDDCKTFNL
uniref:Uncharacterized protein n=1 Tax=Panagrolaimus superbus TaxID=310955 RepID=A0A914YCA4_9BILA